MTEVKINDTDPYFQNLAIKIDAEFTRLEAMQLPDDLEKELVKKIHPKGVDGPPDLHSMFNLAVHLKDKNRH